MRETTHTVLLADGAWGTEIQKRGLPAGTLPEQWNLSKPEVVEALARQYVEAGCDILLTNTFGGNAFVLGRYGLAEKVRQINRAGAEISSRAASGRAQVFGSIGPSGLLPSVDEVGEEVLAEEFKRQIEALCEGGVNGLVVETMSDLVEFRTAVQVAVATGLPVAACMTFDSGPGKLHTMMGVTVKEAARTAAGEGARYVGANCGAGIEHYRDVLRLMRETADLPLWVKPNAGIPELHSGTIAYAMQPERFVAYARQLAREGASVLGGCCGTGPEIIRELAEVLR